jgi:peptide/nickel transport system substrate-binding protein
MKKALNLSLLVLIVVALPIFLSSCKKEKVAETSAAPQFEGVKDINYTGWEVGKEGGTFVYSEFGSDPKTFNAIVADETSSTDITNQMYAGLVRRNQMTLEWEPSLAESWTVADDQKSATFKLRSGLKWSDGQPITADDFVYTYQVIMTDGVQGSSADGFMVGDKPATVTKVDDMTVKITMPEVYAGLMNMASFAALPKHIIEPVMKQGVDAFNSFWGVDTDVTKIVGDGPFVLSEYVPSQRVVMKKNPNYWEKDAKGQQLPYIDQLQFVYVQDQDTQLEKLLSGELDYLSIRGSDYAVLKDKKADLGIELYNVGPDSGSLFITFNQNPIDGPGDAGIKPPALTWLSNLKFRQAMAHLIDRQTMINNIYYGFGYPQYSFIPKFSPYYWPGAADEALKFDPEAAKKLLDEIGYTDQNGDGWRQDPDGNKISLTLSTNAGNTQREQAGTMFTDEVRKVGIDLTFKPVDFNTLVTQLVSTYDWQMIMIGLTGSVDPISGSNVYPSRGNLHMIEPNQKTPRRDWEKQVDAAWNKANNTLDEAQRKAGYQELQKLWIDNLPWVFTVNQARIAAVKTKWGNIFPHPINGYDWAGIVSHIYLK